MYKFNFRYLLIFVAMIAFVGGSGIPLLVRANNINSIPLTNLNVQKELSNLESSSGGKLGLFAINTDNNQRIEYHAEERFPACSTAKVMVVSAILKKSMTNNRLLNQKVKYTKKDVILSGYAPVTKKYLSDGMTVSVLCAAAITQSDNTAMNLLMKKLGGPTAVNSFASSIGDNTFRLDRWELKLNSAIPGDLRDTSTPEAMGKSLQRLVLGDVLAMPQRELLQSWLKNNKTGNSRIRAGVPKGWTVGDKTGTGSYGTTNDIGVIWPPKCSPIIVAIYFTQYKKGSVPRDDIIASATRILLRALGVKS